MLAYLYRVDKGEALAEPEVDIPEDLQFTETGQSMRDDRNQRGGYDA